VSSAAVEGGAGWVNLSESKGEAMNRSTIELQRVCGAGGVDASTRRPAPIAFATDVTWTDGDSAVVAFPDVEMHDEDDDEDAEDDEFADGDEEFEEDEEFEDDEDFLEDDNESVEEDGESDDDSEDDDDDF
jgi:hypothetical protein